MIDIIVSSNCPNCDAQKKIMERSFFPNEYCIIEVGSEKYASFDLKDKVDAVPFIVVRDDETKEIKYAEKGKLDGTSLRQIDRVGSIIPPEEKTFNLREARAMQYSGLGRMDA